MSWRNDPAGSGKTQYGHWDSRTRQMVWQFERFYVWERLDDHYVAGSAGHHPGPGFRVILITDDWYGVARPAIIAIREHIPQPPFVKPPSAYVAPRTIGALPPLPHHYTRPAEPVKETPAERLRRFRREHPGYKAKEAAARGRGAVPAEGSSPR